MSWIGAWNGSWNGAWLGGTAPDPTTGGWEHHKGYKEGRSRKELEEDRKRFGIDVIHNVAKRQSEHLLTDEFKQYEELERELELIGIKIESTHIELLSLERERLLNAEISMLLKKKINDENEALLMILASII